MYIGKRTVGDIVWHFGSRIAPRFPSIVEIGPCKASRQHKLANQGVNVNLQGSGRLPYVREILIYDEYMRVMGTNSSKGKRV